MSVGALTHDQLEVVGRPGGDVDAQALGHRAGLDLLAVDPQPRALGHTADDDGRLAVAGASQPGVQDPVDDLGAADLDVAPDLGRARAR